MNENYGPGSALYEDLARMISDGVRDGWAAEVEVDGRKYRRGRIAEPRDVHSYFSITAVYMDCVEPYRGRYHQHPHGELNLVVPLDAGAKVMGPGGWSGPGWTAPGPGSHHYPGVKGGARIALFHLPAGRISYDITSPVASPDTGEGWACHGLCDDVRGRIAHAARLQGVPACAGATRGGRSGNRAGGPVDKQLMAQAVSLASPHVRGEPVPG